MGTSSTVELRVRWESQFETFVARTWRLSSAEALPTNLYKRLVSAGLKQNARGIIVLGLVLLLSVACKQLVTSMPTAAPKQPALAPSPQRWTRLELFNGQINALLIDDSSPARTLYVGSDGGVFKSQDEGRTWIPCNDGLCEPLVRALAIDPDDPNTLYAGTWDGRVYISTDAGRSWQDRSTDLPRSEVRALAVDTHDPHKLYVGMSQGVFISTNQGEQWLRAGDFPCTSTCTVTVECMVMDPERPDILYVGTSAHSIYKSTSGGTTWFTPTTVLSNFTDFSNVSTLVILPRTPSTIYAISKGKICRTENYGSVWTYVDFWRDEAVALCLAVNPKDAREVYVGLEYGLYKSKDARRSWARSDTGLAPARVQIVAVDPIVTNTVYACSGNQLFISTDAGANWELRSSIRADVAASILVLKGDPKHGDVFYASTAGGGLFKTTDRGNHWQHVGESLPIAWITAIEVEPINTQVLYLGTDKGVVFKSTDGGSHWAGAGNVSQNQAPITALAVDPEQPQRIYAGTVGQGVFRSDDGGVHWSYKGGDIGKNVQRIEIDRRGPQTQVYVLTEKGLFRSQDAGEKWGNQPYVYPVADFAVSAYGPPSLLALSPSNGSILKGQGLEESVTPVPSTFVAANAELKALTASPAQPQTFYALARGVGVRYSKDQGRNWETLGSGLEQLDLRVLALSPDDPNLILVGTDRGIYRYQPGQ